MSNNSESFRLAEHNERNVPWKKWGPYLSERQWGTVREDHSLSGNAWESFPHDHARSRAYYWGEDGLAGISDDKQNLCFALALWNGNDPIIKERLFGLTNAEGNHGEDVKEYYYYLDNTPTHSYMKYLYKYPQKSFPYDELVAANRFRGRKDQEYELIDTGIFDEDRYFDIFVEYAKSDPEDICIKITVHNRGPEAARLEVLPTLWFRNKWTLNGLTEKPILRAVAGATESGAVVEAVHPTLGRYFLYAEACQKLLFTENETNQLRLVGIPNSCPFVKDGINRYFVEGQRDAVNWEFTGTKCAVHYELLLSPGESQTIRLRLTNTVPAVSESTAFTLSFEQVFNDRQQDADEFYKTVIPASLSQDETAVMRQALAGMLWSKQYYSFNAMQWLRQHGYDPLKGIGPQIRNKDWFHLKNDDIISMPDKWEYPWYAAWDLAFHAVTLAMVDPEYAKQQLLLMVDTLYQHPNGQIPAYEWNFSDVNPPVHAWGVLHVYRMEKYRTNAGDIQFLKKMFSKLSNNFTWWVNRKDRFGRNIFEGGFLGLDNISVFDRSKPLPTGGHLEQADGTAWMALFCQNMIEIAIELAAHDPIYEQHVEKFFEHFVWISSAINNQAGQGLWDDEDAFYYDLIRHPNGDATPLKVRSMVGLLPFCAATVIEPYQREQVPNARKHLVDRIQELPEVFKTMHPLGPRHYGVGERGLIALVNDENLRKILHKLLDENEFLSEFGIRSLSRYHAENPYVVFVAGEEHRVEYLPAESDTGLFGGNSNWRGPIWYAVNALIVRALVTYYLYYGDDFLVECPTGSGNLMNLFDVSQEITRRLSKIFLRSTDGTRPVFGGSQKFQTDPHWRDYILFYEYFHGDNGAGLGASHQTGWTGLLANFLRMSAEFDRSVILKAGKSAAFARTMPVGS